MKNKHTKLRYGRNPLYLNANLIYSEALNIIRKPSWKRKIKTGTLNKLIQEGYNLITSILTRVEVIQRLKRDENHNLLSARKVYKTILSSYEISEIASINKILSLNNSFIDSIARSNLDFKDAIHLEIARKLEVPVCTHDKKVLEEFSRHEDKSRFYSHIYKPQELIKQKGML